MGDKPLIIFPFKHLYRERLGIMLLSSIIKAQGYQCIVVEANMKNLTLQLDKEKTYIFAYSTQGGDNAFYVEFNKRLKNIFDDYHIVSIFGGVHPTLFPEETLTTDGVDAICIGEGEYAFLEFVEAIANGKDITSIKNIWVKENGCIIRNSLRPLIDNLDTLPFPDRSLLNIDALVSVTPTLITSRGCPMRCTYCSEEALANVYGLSQWKTRYRSVNNVIEEIEHIQSVSKKKVGFLYFWDSVFFDSYERLYNFTEQYSQIGSIPFQCGLHVGMVSEETVALLKRAGCYTVNFGIECGDEKFRQEVLHRYYSNDDISKAIHILKSHNIRVFTFNMLALPNTTIQNDLETLELNIKIRPDYGFADFYYPMPKTALFERYKEVVDSYSIENFSQATKRPYLKNISNQHYRELIILQRLFSLSVKFPFVIRLRHIIDIFHLEYILYWLNKLAFYIYLYFYRRPIPITSYMKPEICFKALKKFILVLVTH